jgi:hypothetical protein
MSQLPKFCEMMPAIEAGLENLKKWYHRTDDTDAYFICLGMCLALSTISLMKVTNASPGSKLQNCICQKHVG